MEQTSDFVYYNFILYICNVLKNIVILYAYIKLII